MSKCNSENIFDNATRYAFVRLAALISVSDVITVSEIIKFFSVLMKFIIRPPVQNKIDMWDRRDKV